MLHVPSRSFEWGAGRGSAGLDVFCAAGDAGAAMVSAFAGDFGGFGGVFFGHGGGSGWVERWEGGAAEVYVYVIAE